LPTRIAIVTRAASEYCGIASYTEYLLGGLRQSANHGIELSVGACGSGKMPDHPSVAS
jgi:hypothetical protein